MQRGTVFGCEQFYITAFSKCIREPIEGGFCFMTKEVFRYVSHTLRVTSENRKIFNRVEPRINSSLAKGRTVRVFFRKGSG